MFDPQKHAKQEDLDRVTKVFTEVLMERVRQADKFGADEDHPSLDPTLTWGLTKGEMNTEVTISRAAQRYEIPTAKRAQDLRNRSSKAHLSWPTIVVEELAESVEAAVRWGDGPLLRAEIIQTIATCFAWVENIDRRSG